MGSVSRSAAVAATAARWVGDGPESTDLLENDAQDHDLVHGVDEVLQEVEHVFDDVDDVAQDEDLARRERITSGRQDRRVGRAPGDRGEQVAVDENGSFGLTGG